MARPACSSCALDDCARCSGAPCGCCGNRAVVHVPESSPAADTAVVEATTGDRGDPPAAAPEVAQYTEAVAEQGALLSLPDGGPPLALDRWQVEALSHGPRQMLPLDVLHRLLPTAMTVVPPAPAGAPLVEDHAPTDPPTEVLVEAFGGKRRPPRVCMVPGCNLPGKAAKNELGVRDGKGLWCPEEHAKLPREERSRIYMAAQKLKKETAAEARRLAKATQGAGASFPEVAK